MKKLVFSVLIFLSSINIFAQSTNSFFKDYVSRSWNSEDGIPGNSITDICQDKDGYIYFGTYGGLIRFDGVKFVTINKISNSRFNFITARSIFQDSRGDFWVGSNDEGVFCLTSDGNVISYTSESGLPNNSIRAFCEDTNGNIWIGTASGVAVVSKNYEIINLKGFETIPEDNNFIVSQLFCDSAGRVWIITKTEDGLFVYSDERFEYYKGIHSLENPIVTAMNQDSSGALWFGVAPAYAVRMYGSEEKVYYVGNSDETGATITCIYQDSSKNIWFGSEAGITILHDGLLSYYSKEEGLADLSVVKIIEDKEKNIWIATDHGGIEKLSYGKFQTTQMSTIVNAIAQDNFRKVVWLGCDDGLYCYRGDEFINNEITDYCKNLRIRHVSLTKKGSLLVSTYEKQGQLKFNLDGSIESWTKDNGLAGDRIRVAEEMTNGDLYIGTRTGLSIVEHDTGNIINITKGAELENDYIMCLYEAPDGSVWVGTDGGGIFILKDKKISKIITKKDNLAGNVVFKISGYKNDEIWISTGSGASRYKNGKIFTFNSSNGFGTDGIFQLIPDFSGRMWGLSNRGIFYVKMDEIEDVIEGKKTAVNTKYYNRLDGITSSGVTATSLSMKDELGRIWFTLIDGFTIFDPVRNASKNLPPEVKIEDILVDGEEYTVKNKTVVLKPQTKRLNINYTGISFISSEQLLFKSKLSGFDKDYSKWTNQRSATYTNLKPGTYKFSIIAQNGDEVLSTTDDYITIIKEPYLWQRPWFIIMIIIIVGLLVSAAIIRKLNKLKKEKEKTENLSMEIINALVSTIDAKDPYTKGHSRRVADYSLKLAKMLGLKEEEQKEVFYSALLHDIGKIGLPDEILNKNGPLTSEEYEIVKTHPDIGYKILKSISIMPKIAIGAKDHHENYGGNGYPENKYGTDIPFIARIIRVADSYDAMTSDRSYRTALDQATVKDQIARNIGSQFDPNVAEKMLELIEKDIEYDMREKAVN